MKAKVHQGITLATYVTFLRFLFVPCMLVSMLQGSWVLATLFFVLASFTDLLDGILARSLNQVSWLGTILDPLADKFLLIAVCVGLAYGDFLPLRLPVWFLVIVIVHEILLMSGAAYWSLYKHDVPISPSRLAKLLGVAQFLFFFWTFLSGLTGTILPTLFNQLLVLIACARICLLIQYGIQTYKQVTS